MIGAGRLPCDGQSSGCVVVLSRREAGKEEGVAVARTGLRYGGIAVEVEACG